MAKRDKPKPISLKLASAPPLPPEDPAGKGGINQAPPVSEKRMARAERAMDNLLAEVRDIRKRPAPEIPAPVVNIAPRPRITKVTIKYDQLGFPSELIPQYEG